METWQRQRRFIANIIGLLTLVPICKVISDSFNSVGVYQFKLFLVFKHGINVYNIVLMRNFFEGIPSSLYEAAKIDGCSLMGILFRIVLPLSKAALASIGLTPTTSYQVSQNTLYYAGIVMAILPFMLLYPFLQKYFVKGVNIGAVKE